MSARDLHPVPFIFEGYSVRVVTDAHGEPLFHAADVCAALGFANSRQALDSHVDLEDVQKLDTPTAGGLQQANHVNESGMYALIIGSTKAEAKRFKRWVISEVLPSIRRTGKYITPAAAGEMSDLFNALRLTPMAVRAARALGLDQNAASIGANQLIHKLTGQNLLRDFGSTHLVAENQATQWFTPTQLGSRIMLSALALNKLLAEAGFQVRGGKLWELTDAGRPFARLYDTGKSHNSGVPVQQIKWSPAVIDAARKASGKGGQTKLL